MFCAHAGVKHDRQSLHPVLTTYEKQQLISWPNYWEYFSHTKSIAQWKTKLGNLGVSSTLLARCNNYEMIGKTLMLNYLATNKEEDPSEVCEGEEKFNTIVGGDLSLVLE